MARMAARATPGLSNASLISRSIKATPSSPGRTSPARRAGSAGTPWPPDGTRPSSRSASALLATGVRPTRRITSPSFRPARAAALPCSTAVITAPLLFSSRSWRAICGVMFCSVMPKPTVGSGSSGGGALLRPARAWLPSASRSSSSTVRLSVRSLPSRTMRTGTVLPGPRGRDERHQLVVVADGLAVERGDDVARLHAGLLRPRRSATPPPPARRRGS